MMVVTIDPRDPTPIYAQLERGLRAAIASGRLRPGDQLPTVRELAVELRVNANTVAIATNSRAKAYPAATGSPIILTRSLQSTG